MDPSPQSGAPATEGGDGLQSFNPSGPTAYEPQRPDQQQLPSVAESQPEAQPVPNVQPNVSTPTSGAPTAGQQPQADYSQYAPQAQQQLQAIQTQLYQLVQAQRDEDTQAQAHALHLQDKPEDLQTLGRTLQERRMQRQVAAQQLQLQMERLALEVPAKHLVANQIVDVALQAEPGLDREHLRQALAGYPDGRSMAHGARIYVEQFRTLRNLERANKHVDPVGGNSAAPAQKSLNTMSTMDLISEGYRRNTQARARKR